MKKYKLLLIILAIIFFLTGLTIYINKVVFPTQIKNLVTTQAQQALGGRKVEIESIRFNWLKGFIVDKVKIYQKDSNQPFLQAEKISAGLIIIPGSPAQVNFTFLNIDQPSVHLIHQDTNIWNFSDLLQAPSNDKPLPVKINISAINFTDATIRIDDKAQGRDWTEIIDVSSVKVGLSLKGISFDVDAKLPKKNGVIQVQGTYQLLEQSLSSHIKLTNIKPAEYLSFLPAIKDFSLNDGIIKSIDGEISYSKDEINASGNISCQNIDATYSSHHVKGNLEAKNFDLIFKKDDVTLKGDINLKNSSYDKDTLIASADIHALINQSQFKKDRFVMDGSLQANNAQVQFSPTQTIKGTFILDKTTTEQSPSLTQIKGSLEARNLDINWDGQSLNADLALNPLNVAFKDLNDISFNGNLNASKAIFAQAGGATYETKIDLQRIKGRFKNLKNLTLNTKVSLEQMALQPNKDTLLKGSIELPTLDLTFADDTLKIKTEGDLNNWDISLANNQRLVMESSLTLDLTCPIKTPTQSVYAGTLTVHNASFAGLPIGDINEIQFKGDFITDQLNVKLFSLVALQTSIKGAGTLMNFTSPVVNVEIVSDAVDLSKLKTVLPNLYDEYGLTTSGSASFNFQFQGLVKDPLSGKINASAKLTDADFESTKFNQRIEHVSGDLQATPDSASWQNFKATYLGKPYTLSGSLTDFKNPQIKTSLDGADVKLTAELTKNNDDLHIKTLKGQYLDINFDTNGQIKLGKAAPQIDLDSTIKTTVAALMPLIPEATRKQIENYKITGELTATGHIKGQAMDWTQWTSSMTVTSPALSVMGYSLTGINLNFTQQDGRLNNAVLDMMAYDGKVHAVGNATLSDSKYPFELALNVDSLDLHKLKMDISELKSKEINGKFYLTTVVDGNALDLASIKGKGSLAIREGFLTEFEFFKGISSIFNLVLKLGQVAITDVEGNFMIAEKKINSENLRLKSPTIVLISNGWVDFDQNCNIIVTVDMMSGIIPPIAEDVLRSLEINFFDKITSPNKKVKYNGLSIVKSVLSSIGIFQ